MADGSSQSVSKQHAAARQWARKGFHVFPCVPGEKKPLIKGGVHAATADLEQIDEWWRRHPEANIGCSPDASGCYVLDVDVKNGKDGEASLAVLEREHGALPATLTVRTPSGSRHLWFRGKAPSTAGALGIGVDTRGEGTGYVLLPGSTFNGQDYVTALDTAPAAAPAWIGEAFVARRRDAHAAATDDLDAPINIARAIEWLKRRAPAIEGEGGDDWTYRTICGVKDFGISQDLAPDLMSDWNERCVPPWDEDELLIKIENAYGYGQNDAGSKAQLPVEVSFEGLKGAEPAASSPPTDYRKKERDRFVPLSRTYLASLPKREWLQDGWFPKIGSGMLYGPPGSYKTYTVHAFALDLAATGKVVAQFIGESDPQEIWARIHAWEQSRRCEMPSTYFPFFDLPRATPAEVQLVLDRLHEEGINPDFVSLDTLTRMLAGMDPGAFRDMSMAIEAIEILKTELHCFVLGIGHTGKDAERGLLGSIVGLANPDISIQVDGDDKALTSTWKPIKTRFARKPEPMVWQGEQCEDGALAFRVLPPDSPAARVIGRSFAVDLSDKHDWAMLAADALSRAGYTVPEAQIATSVLADLIKRYADERMQLAMKAGKPADKRDTTLAAHSASTISKRLRERVSTNAAGGRRSHYDGRLAACARNIGADSKAEWVWHLPANWKGLFGLANEGEEDV